MIENFRQKVEETINFLPPLPSIMMELIQAVNVEDVDLRTLGKIISRDPGMVMNVLKIANSAFYGLPTKITSIEQAVHMLGTNEITSLCISCSASRSLRPPKGVPSFDLKQFWRHSVATGVIGKILCNKLNVGRHDSLYLAGLVHDMGKVILDRFVHDVYKQIIDLTYEENISILEAETRIMGASHDVVGGWLMEKWQFPPVFGEVARHHHSVTDAPEKNIVVVAIINVADQLARLKGFGFGGDMNGVDFSITDSFKVLEKKNRDLANLDVFKLVWDLDGAHEEIVEMERLVNG